MEFHKINKGRDNDFKCMICGKYVSYDRRKTIIKYTQSWDEDEEIIGIYHKKCYNKKAKKLK